MPSVSHHNIRIFHRMLVGPGAFATWFADEHSFSWKHSDDHDLYDGTFSSRLGVDLYAWLHRLDGSVFGM